MASYLSAEKWEMLINLVQENPGLFDYSHPSHKNQMWTKNVWEKISSQLNVEGLDGPMLRQKWKNKRDEYMKKKRKLDTWTSGSSGKVVKKGFLYNEMSFLEPYIPDRRTPRKTSRVQSGDSDDNGDPGSVEHFTVSGSSSDGLESLIKTEDCGPCSEDNVISAPQKRHASTTPPPPRPSVQQLKRIRKDSANPRVDSLVVEDMRQQCNERIENRPKLQDALRSTQRSDDESDFFNMIGRRVNRMTPDIQAWMEEEVWSLYIQARRMDQGVTRPQQSSHSPWTSASSLCQPQEDASSS